MQKQDKSQSIQKFGLVFNKQKKNKDKEDYKKLKECNKGKYNYKKTLKIKHQA